MILGRRATLRLTPAQECAFGRACGVARWAWNWGLSQKREAWAERRTALDAGVAPADAPRVPTAIDLHKRLNLLKRVAIEDGGVPWMYKVSAHVPQEALRDLDNAFSHFFRRVKNGEAPGYPRFKAKGRSPGHFHISQPIHVTAGCIQIPRIGKVHIMPGDRGYIPDGTYAGIHVVEDHGRWCASVRVEVAEAPRDDTKPTVGLDVGVRELAHLSDGTVIPNPRALEREAKCLHKAKLSIARKQRAADKTRRPYKKGERRIDSNRLKRARAVAAKLAQRVANIRLDALHKATTTLAKTYSTIKVEDLAGPRMTKAKVGKGRARKACLNRSILDSGMLRIRPLLAYKMPLYGGTLEVVPAPYTSQTCSRCGVRNDPGSSKTYRCAACGFVADRDDNASQNILSAASCTAESKRVSARASRGAAVRPTAKAVRRAASIRQSNPGGP